MQGSQSVRKSEGGEILSSPKFWLVDSSVDSSHSSDFGGSVTGLASWDLIKGISHFINLKQSVLSSSSTYIWPVSGLGVRASLTKKILKSSYLFILKQWYIHAYIYTHNIYYGMCVCEWIHTCWNIIKQLLNCKGDTGLPGIFFAWWQWNQRSPLFNEPILLINISLFVLLQYCLGI